MPVARWLSLLLLLVGVARAEDWPGWLGPRRDGTSTEKIQAWKGDLKPQWKVSVGPGHSSPVIAAGKVYLHTKVPDKTAEELLCFDADTGKKLWGSSYSRSFFFSPFGTGPQATPTVSGNRIYTYGITGVLSCYDANTGDQVWQINTRKEFSPPGLVFGTACSPLVEDQQVVLNLGAKGASIVSFGKDKGEVVWKSLDDGPSYSSGIKTTLAGEQQLVFLTQLGVRGLSPKDGRKLWEFPLKDKANESSTTPVVAGETLLASSITFGMVGLKIEKKGGGFEVKQRWQNPKLTCYFSTPIPVGSKHVYVVTGQMSFTPTSSLHCVEVETGKILWTVPKIGKYHAAMLKTADNKLLLLSDLGDLILFEPDPERYKELARSKLVKGEGIWAHPALVDGKVYFRDDKELICLRLPQ